MVRKMRKVTEVKYLWNNEQPTEYVVNEVKCGIITEGKGFTDLCINDRKIEEVEEILQDYMEDEEIDDLADNDVKVENCISRAEMRVHNRLT